MEFLLLVLGIILLVVGYFCFGILVKFLIAWWILALGVPVLIAMGLALGWVGAIIAIAGFIGLLGANNRWHECELYLALERKIDSVFYLSDT